jgi:hypothetical protein
LLKGATVTLQGLTGLSVIGSNAKGSALQRLSLQLSIYLSWATGFSNISRPILNRSQSAGTASLVSTINKQLKPDTQDQAEQDSGDSKESDDCADGAIKQLKSADTASLVSTTNEEPKRDTEDQAEQDSGDSKESDDCADGTINQLKSADTASLVSTTNQEPKRDTEDETEQESGDSKEPKDGADDAETQRASTTAGEDRAAEARRSLKERQETQNSSREMERREREAEGKRKADARSAMRSSASTLGISAPSPTEPTSDVQSGRRHQYWPPEQADLEQESQGMSKQDGGAAKAAAIVNAIPASEAPKHDVRQGHESYYEADEQHVHSQRPVSSNPTGVPVVGPVQGSLEAAQVHH